MLNYLVAGLFFTHYIITKLTLQLIGNHCSENYLGMNETIFWGIQYIIWVLDSSEYRFFLWPGKMFQANDKAHGFGARLKLPTGFRQTLSTLKCQIFSSVCCFYLKVAFPIVAM